MGGPARVTGSLDTRSRMGFFGCEIVCKDQPLETKLEFAFNFYVSETQPVCTSISGTRIGRISSLGFLTSSSVATFDGLNSDSRDEVCFASAWHGRKNIAPEVLHSRSAFLNFRPDASSQGEHCMKDTIHPVVHFSVLRRIFGTVRSRRSCAWGNDQFGHGQNTGSGWSDPTFVHGSVPKVVRRVAPAQLRGDRAECFVL
jgi:hypothetical protein